MNRAVCAVLLFTLAACGPGGPMDTRPGVASKRDAVLSGKVTFDDPEIFAFEPPGFMCSSTLIGRRTLLTAAHCVTDEVTGGVIGTAGAVVTNVPDSNHAVWPRDYIRVSAIRRHPGYVPIVNDVAMLQLEREPPVPLKVWNKEALTAAMAFTDIRIVGYGVTDTGLEDSGLKRSGMSMLKVIDAKQFTYGKQGANKNGACQGDSGGPALKVFPDGTERVIGITSFDTGGCGANTDARVDAYASFIQAGLDLYEASCLEDGMCKQGCTPVDPDCNCIADGVCRAAQCNGLALDPDCSNSCGVSGVCSTAMAGCGGQDPDCQPVGQGCGYADHCESRLCITSAQHARPYCSKACTASTGCPSDMECVSNQCQFKVLPTANVGEPCTPGATYCVGSGMFCAGWAKEPALTCRSGCYEDADCPPDNTCRPSPQAPGVCIPNITFPVLAVETVHPPPGCSTAPGMLLPGLLALLALRRRRH